MRRLAFAVLSLAAAAGAAELALRLAWSDPAPPPPPEIPAGDWPELENFADISARNQRGIFKGAFHRTNAHGFRGPDYEPTPPLGHLRILVTGDSLAMGAGVAERDRFSDVVQRRLDADAGWPPVQVINVAVGGANIASAMQRLSRGLELYGADITVYAWGLDDVRNGAFERVREPAEAMAAFRAQIALEQQRSFLVRTLSPLLADWTRRVSGGEAPPDDLIHNYFDNERAWSEFARGLATFARLSRRADACPLVLIQPKLADLGPSHPYRRVYRRVADAATEQGLDVVDAFPYHAWTRAEPLWVRPMDPHPNANGHAILADALEDGLRALPERCRAAAGSAGPKPARPPA